MEEFHKPFYYDEIVEGGHAAGATSKTGKDLGRAVHLPDAQADGLILQMTRPKNAKIAPPGAILALTNLVAHRKSHKT